MLSYVLQTMNRQSISCHRVQKRNFSYESRHLDQSGYFQILRIPSSRRTEQKTPSERSNALFIVVRLDLVIVRVLLGELFYICNLKYRYLLNHSHISLWYRITGLINTKLENNETIIIDKQPVPLLFSDPIVLLLRIMLSLPYLIPKGTFFHVIMKCIIFLRIVSSDCTSFI